MNQYGFIRITCLAPTVHIANPNANIETISTLIQAHAQSDILLFPELSLTAYSCGDLFHHEVLVDEAQSCLLELAQQVKKQLVFIGLPLRVGQTLYNCGVALNQGRIIGIFPKQFLANYNEFYEARWFRAANGDEPKTVMIGGEDIPFGIDLLFKFPGNPSVIISGSLCEEDWMPLPPSAFQAMAGATVQCNLSASNETVGKHNYRLNTLIIGQSGRHLSACAYASAGASESTTDLVFSGHLAIAENGQLLANTGQMTAEIPQSITTDIDVSDLINRRQRMGSYADCSARYTSHPFRYLEIELPREATQSVLLYPLSATPFVPQKKADLITRCTEIMEIQTAALKKRLQQLGDDPHIWIGISGGLDSTLALLVALKAYDRLKLPRENIHGLTLPGFGTSRLTKNNADHLMTLTHISRHEEDISQLAFDTFKSQQHYAFGVIPPTGSLTEFKQALSHLTTEQLKKGDLVFENVQARLRTFLLMSHGFVVGTGDLSEMALGWCTYNADHMSMYNVNCSIPKTLVRWLVNHVAEYECGAPLREVLLSISATPISPELLPLDSDGKITQLTESSVGAYELHDFFLYAMLRKGYAPKKILYLAAQVTFSQVYSPAHLKATLKLFYQRFFSQQYKRSCVPDGPKVGSVSLSPRGDWRMPSDAEVSVWLNF